MQPWNCHEDSIRTKRLKTTTKELRPREIHNFMKGLLPFERSDFNLGHPYLVRNHFIQILLCTGLDISKRGKDDFLSWNADILLSKKIKFRRFYQVTVRFHTQQTLAVYDRFGRLSYGSEVVAKDVLEYVVFENHVANAYGKWRIHDKVIPDWMPKPEPALRTFWQSPPEATSVEDSSTTSVGSTASNQPSLGWSIHLLIKLSQLRNGKYNIVNLKRIVLYFQSRFSISFVCLVTVSVKE